jgi:hypothetical protein
MKPPTVRFLGRSAGQMLQHGLHSLADNHAGGWQPIYKRQNLFALAGVSNILSWMSDVTRLLNAAPHHPKAGEAL